MGQKAIATALAAAVVVVAAAAAAAIAIGFTKFFGNTICEIVRGARAISVCRCGFCSFQLGSFTVSSDLPTDPIPASQARPASPRSLRIFQVGLVSLSVHSATCDFLGLLQLFVGGWSVHNNHFGLDGGPIPLPLPLLLLPSLAPSSSHCFPLTQEIID